MLAQAFRKASGSIRDHYLATLDEMDSLDAAVQDKLRGVGIRDTAGLVAAIGGETDCCLFAAQLIGLRDGEEVSLLASATMRLISRVN